MNSPPYKKQTNLGLFMKLGMNILSAEATEFFARFDFPPTATVKLLQLLTFWSRNFTFKF